MIKAFDDRGFDFTYCANADRCSKREQCYRGRGPDKRRDSWSVSTRVLWSNFYWTGNDGGECSMQVPYNSDMEGKDNGN